MDDTLDGTQTRGLKGLPYDWQNLLVPDEPTFSRELSELIDGEFVSESK